MKYIPGFEELYSATEDGRIYSHVKGKYLKPAIQRDGYLIVVLQHNKDKKTCKVHRLVALTYIPNVENKYAIDHINRIKSDNNVSNLRWATRSENRINTIVHSHNRLGHKHIGLHRGLYLFVLNRNGQRYEKAFKTLEEAIEYRDAYLAQ